MNYIVAQVLAGLAVIITFLGYLKNDKGNFLKYVLISNILYCIHYFFLNDLSFVIAIIIGSFRNVVFLKYVNSKRLVPVYILLLFELLTIAFGCLVADGLFSLVPIFQVCLYTYGVWQPNLGKMYFICFIVMAIGIFYNFFIGTYVAIIGSVIEIVASILGLVKLNFKKVVKLCIFIVCNFFFLVE